MDYGDYYWGLYRGYYKDPFPHSLLRTRQTGAGRYDVRNASLQLWHILSFTIVFYVKARVEEAIQVVKTKVCQTPRNQQMRELTSECSS